MKEIKAKALFKIKSGKLDEFKILIAKFIDTVKGNEPGTLRYNWYLNEEAMECVVLEDYADSAAVLVHAGNVGPLLQESASLADLSLEVYGKPSGQLVKAMEGMNIKMYPFYRGI